MNIYHVERTDKCDYDEFSDFVCFANTEDEAKAMHPYGPEYYVFGSDGWRMIYKGLPKEKADEYNGWTNSLDNVKVYHIGISLRDVKPDVVCASYHAG